MSEEGAYCTKYICEEGLRPCTCPNCGGFLGHFNVEGNIEIEVDFGIYNVFDIGDIAPVVQYSDGRYGIP